MFVQHLYFRLMRPLVADENGRRVPSLVFIVLDYALCGSKYDYMNIHVSKYSYVVFL